MTGEKVTLVRRLARRKSGQDVRRSSPPRRKSFKADRACTAVLQIAQRTAYDWLPIPHTASPSENV